MNTVQLEVQRLWRASHPLTAAGLSMLIVFVMTLVGLVADPRVISGAPAWLKPAKFAISTAVYALTFAWIFTYLDGWSRLKRIVGATTAVVLVLEVLLISAQAARGTTSHFNIATPLDTAVFAVMGIAILLAWVASVALAVALFRQPLTDRSLSVALRLGLLLTVVGSATGGLMTRPTSAQLEAVRTTHRMTVAGGHTVGGPDGAPGLPVTGWSREHGDLRVPHFLGLHAVQVLPLIALLLRPIRSPARRRRAVLLAAASYASLFGILLAQALAGHSLLAPEGATFLALVAWLGATAFGVVFVVTERNGSNASSIDGVVSL